MRMGIVSFTEKGEQLALRIREALSEDVPEICARHGNDRGESLSAWTGRQFEKKNALVFVGACGIAVRAIAPFVRDKLTDSPVVVVDENGSFVIPLLSGHVGGANRLAQMIADRIGGTCVLTTATDVNGCFAVDVFAGENGLSIVNREGIAAVSGRLLAGEEVTVFVEEWEKRLAVPEQQLPKGLRLVTDFEKPPGIVISAHPQEFEQKQIPVRGKAFGTLLFLKPREYVLGIGCKRGKSFARLDAFIRRTLLEAELTQTDIAGIASIGEKKEEAGILEWAQRYRIPFETFSAQELLAVEGHFHGSAFVKETVGVDNVCERAAMAFCRDGGKLVLPKTAEDGMTLAIAKREWKIRWK